VSTNDPVDKFFEETRVGPPYFESTPNITPEAEGFYKQLFDEIAEEMDQEAKQKEEDALDEPDIYVICRKLKAEKEAKEKAEKKAARIKRGWKQ
jgi:hypothetical protein